MKWNAHLAAPAPGKGPAKEMCITDDGFTPSQGESPSRREIMPVDVKCMSCRKRLHVPDHLAGRRVTCPRCGEALPVPVPEAPETAPAPPSAEQEEDALSTLPRFGRLGVVS